MFGKNPRTSWMSLSLAGVVAGLFIGFAPGQEKEEAGFTLAEFQELKAKLDVKKQPWATIPWQVSLTEARELAARTQKPIFMMVGTGNCLGWG
jgi:hypothetical protein